MDGETMSTAKIIYILWLRQMKRYMRSPARIVGSLGQPLLFLLALGFGLGPVIEQAGGGSYFQFLVPGVIAMSILFTAVFSGIDMIWDRQFGFLKETLVAPASRVTIMLGRTLGGATIAALQGCVVLILSIAFGFRFDIVFLPLALLFMAFIALLFTALGTAIGSVLEDMQGFPLIMNFVMMPLFFLSGALFPLTGLPKILEYITRLNPLSYGVDGLRHALVHAGIFNVMLDITVLGTLTILLLWLGGYLFSKIQV
jgi:ABC-2 type transport system permease protein